MAQKVWGIDLGSFSVHAVELEVGFRTRRVLSVLNQRLDSTKPWLEAVSEALGQIRASHAMGTDSVCVAIPGDQLAIHTLSLPFEDSRKIAQVVGVELESQIPWDLEDVYFDYSLAGPAAQASGSLVIAVAAKRQSILELIEQLKLLGIDPHAVVPAPLTYAACPEVSGTVAWVDMGHKHTNVCVMSDGLPRFARTLSHGGWDVTMALAKGLQITLEQAEQLKHQGEFDSGSGMVSEALSLLVRDLRVTISACELQTGTRVERIGLCGGSAALAGFDQELASALELPVEPGRAGALDEDIPADATVAFGCALRAAEKVRLPNLRVGEIAYRGDVSFLRDKAVQLVALGLLILSLAVATGISSLWVIKRDRRQLQERLASETRALFGQEILDGQEVSRRLKGHAKSEGPPLPQKSAFDLLVELSSKTPAELRLDVAELDVKAKKTYVKATTDSAATVDALVDAWKTSDCIGEVQKGRVADTAGGQEKQFTLTVDTRCF